MASSSLWTLVEARHTMRRVDDHRFVFLAGLHRSGTTLLARLLAAHPEVSGFSDTGVPADEGQHLQTVYPAAKVWGGPGRFGFAPEAHFTEEQASRGEGATVVGGVVAALGSRAARAAREVAAKPSENPLLAGAFPGSRSSSSLRHPIPVSLPTAQWRGTRRYGPAVRALAPLPRDLRGGQPRAGARARDPYEDSSASRRACCAGSSSSSSSTRSRQASPSIRRSEESTSAVGGR